ncbi:uncharacterized membrane protein HdeD (DUF308 family) [Brevibacterium sanguinis]|uniref:Uncharacterized membrane protein HdeD (DUF308 family) n=2 Tax=Brevibacterium TaxID=1696 RepID=A0A366IGB8_9MICO|nr:MULTISPECIES: DUF308 domain-containing protein [Brevibacterium]RBP62250.1 uncharacterized membrane protein HdeD (DUF308 family) [Brevibacterium sanguinis]RBP70618.1 uncharacterized membrane protein HdeD (DUF308 family) [Brevibacterium celere]
MDLRRTGRTVIVNGAIAVLVGVLMIAWPGATAEVVVRIFACWLAVIALTSLVLAPRRTGGLIARAVLLILLAALVFVSPMFFAAFVTVLAGMAIIVLSVLAISASLILRRMGMNGWWLLTLIGVAGIAIGGFFLFAPQAGITALIFTLAVFIGIVGVALIALGVRLRRLAAEIAQDPRRHDGGDGDVIRGEIIE